MRSTVQHIFCFALAMASTGVAIAKPFVTTKNGDLQGTQAEATDAFLGVPYAQAPVGALRWAAPLPAKAWTGSRDATRSAPACYQSPPGHFGPYTDEFLIDGKVSEDCLYLNVWRPRNVAEKLPVFVFIHGGGFGSGSNAIPIYEGAGLAARGAIVVTINYRVGVFGFLAHRELTREGGGTSGNYGLMDMVQALKWVRDNIAAFGGDAGNVTIAGQSAGAAAVNDLVMSPMAKGLFHKAVAQSGSGMGLRLAPLSAAEQRGEELAKQLNVTTLAQLRSVDAAKLQQVAAAPSPKSDGNSTIPRIGFAPNLDGKVLVADPSSTVAKPVSDVPFITGFDSDEGLAFGVPETPDQLIAYAKRRYGDFADRLLALYPHADAAQVASSVQLMARDSYMSNMIFWAQARSGMPGQSVFTYLFDQPYPAADGKSFGAFHTAEVPYVLGALGKGGRVFTPTDYAVSKRMQDHWLAFMKTGNPSIPGATWAAVTPKNPMAMTIGSSTKMQWAVSSLERYSAFKAFVDQGGRLSLF